MTCSEVRAEELALELDPNVQVKEEARRLSEQSNLSDQAQGYQPYPCNNDDVVSKSFHRMRPQTYYFDSVFHTSQVKCQNCNSENLFCIYVDTFKITKTYKYSMYN